MNDTTTPTTPRFLSTCWTSGGNIMPARTGDFSPEPIERRVSAAAAAGFTGFGITFADLTVVQKTIGYDGLADLFREHGIVDVELEYIDDWWTIGERRTASDRMRAGLFEAAVALDAHHVKAGLGQESDVFDEGVVFAEFDRLATEAKSAGTLIALEPAAFSMTPTIAPGARMVGEVRNPAGGLLVDIWHVYRSGVTYDEMARIVPADFVFAVELNDGAREPRGTLYEDTFDNRLYVGDGVFDVAAFVRAIEGLGYTGMWGLEMMSEAYRALPVEVGTREVLAAARSLFATTALRRPARVTSRSDLSARRS